jgi:ectoine hydroxylase-related dioxygenase (phytanoyl-CoA dioxygenase family)
MRGILQYADAAMRAYGNPKLLAIAASVNGEDFVPFSEAYVFKAPGQGAALAWHQDGMTHWDSPEFGPNTHGFNFMTQLYPSTAENGVWFVPGSHRRGKVDIPALIDAAGGNFLPDAVPLVCDAGDVAISNRQTLHGSFPNITNDWRVTINMGFFPHDSVIGVTSPTQRGPVTFGEAHVSKRAAMIGYAIDARRQRYPDETPFIYQPHQQSGATYRWSEDLRRSVHGYHEDDINI